MAPAVPPPQDSVRWAGRPASPSQGDPALLGAPRSPSGPLKALLTGQPSQGAQGPPGASRGTARHPDPAGLGLHLLGGGHYSEGLGTTGSLRWGSLPPSLPLTTQVCWDPRRAALPPAALPRPGASACRAPLLPPAKGPLGTLGPSPGPSQQQLEEEAQQQHQRVHAAPQSRWACPLRVGGALATPRSITELQVLTSLVQNRRPPSGPSAGGDGASKPGSWACTRGLP